MNRFTLAIILSSLLALPAAQAADEEDHNAHHPGNDQAQAASAPDDMGSGMKMENMQKRLKTMQDLMSKMNSTTDPQERQRLMDEHMQAMREGMKMMHGMGGGRMGKKKDCDAIMEGGGDTAGMRMGMMMMRHDKMMEDRMNMMQMMMEQMMEHEAMERQMESK